MLMGKSYLFKSVLTLTLGMSVLTSFPIVEIGSVVLANDGVVITDDTQNQGLVPKLINQATDEEMNPDEIRFHPVIYLNDVFGEGKNIEVTKSINFFSDNNVNKENVPDSYQFLKVVVKSDPSPKDGKEYIKEIDRVLRIDGIYYARIKGTAQDYLKFTDQKQLMVIYNRFLRIGFKDTSASSSQTQYINQNGILNSLTGFTPKEKYDGLTSEHLQNGFYIAGQQDFVDGRLYIIPDFKSVQFSRKGFTELSRKRGTGENNAAVDSVVNFYDYRDKTNTTYAESLTNYGILDANGQIKYDYFVKRSGEIWLERIPTMVPKKDEQLKHFKLHFPNDFSTLKKYTMINSDDAILQTPKEAIKYGHARPSWMYLYGRDITPYTTQINGKSNDYPIVQGGTVSFTIAPADHYKYFNHMNKLVINGQLINIPESRSREKAYDKFSQQYTKTTYTYLKTGELVVVSFVPLADGLKNNYYDDYRYLKGAPFYFVTVMNVQGDISIYGSGEQRADGSIAQGPDVSFIQDGGFTYGKSRGTMATLSATADGVQYNDTDNVSTILSVDHDLDISSSIVYSGKISYAPVAVRDLPQGYFFDGEKENGLGIKKSRRLIVDTQNPLKYRIKKGSKTNTIDINDRNRKFRGRYFDFQNTEAQAPGNLKDGYVSTSKNGYEWIDFKSVETTEDFGVAIYRVDLIDKKFKTFDIQFQDINGQALNDKKLSNIVFPRTDVALTSSFTIDDFGGVKSLVGSDTVIGSTVKNQQTVPVKQKDEVGVITIPALPEGATFYQLVSVTTNGKVTTLSPKKFLPGQQVFTGQFLPNQTDFGDVDGIDNGSLVTLRAVKIEPFQTTMEETFAQSVGKPDMQVQSTETRFVEDTFRPDNFVKEFGGASELGDQAYSFYNPHHMKEPTPENEPASVYTLKNFNDSSYEIAETKLTVIEKPMSQLLLTPQKVRDPLTQNAQGMLEKPVTLATAEPAGAQVVMTKQKVTPDYTVQLSQGTVQSIRVDLGLWKQYGTDDQAALPIVFDVYATGVDDRVQPVLPQREARSSNRVANRRARSVSTVVPPTVDSSVETVTLSLEKATSPTPAVKATENESTLTFTIDAQVEDFTAPSDKNGTAVQVFDANQNDLYQKVTSIEKEGSRWKVTVQLNRVIHKADQLTLTYRYNYRYQHTSASVNISPNWRDISNTGLKLICSPFLWVLVLTGGAVGVARYRKMKMK